MDQVDLLFSAETLLKVQTICAYPAKYSTDGQKLFILFADAGIMWIPLLSSNPTHSLFTRPEGELLCTLLEAACAMHKVSWQIIEVSTLVNTLSLSYFVNVYLLCSPPTNVVSYML